MVTVLPHPGASWSHFFHSFPINNFHSFCSFYACFRGRGRSNCAKVSLTANLLRYLCCSLRYFAVPGVETTAAVRGEGGNDVMNAGTCSSKRELPSIEKVWMLVPPHTRSSGAENVLKYASFFFLVTAFIMLQQTE